MSDPKLTPSHHGKECLGNGRHPGIEICCDNCDHYLTCFPDWRELCEMSDEEVNALLTSEEQEEAKRRTAAIWERLQAERIVANCVANQRLEGLTCDEADVAAVRRIARGETTAEEEVAAVLAKYRE